MILKNEARIFWCDIPNAGDQFNLDLLRHYGFTPEMAPVDSTDSAEIVATGSILAWPHCNFTGAIMGAGFMFAESSHPFNRAAVFAVRGKLSMTRVFRKGIVLGDPGLLANRIYVAERNQPQFALGIIPHFADFDCPVVQQLAAKDPKNTLLIDIKQKPAEVIQQITRCAAVVSSSLHGLIFADAFNFA